MHGENTDARDSRSAPRRRGRAPGPSKRSLERTVTALREFGRDGATLHELRHVLGLSRGHRGPGLWVNALVGQGRVQVVPRSSPPRYRLRPATDREVTAALQEDARRAIARAKQIRDVLAERHRR